MLSKSNRLPGPSLKPPLGLVNEKLSGTLSLGVRYLSWLIADLRDIQVSSPIDFAQVPGVRCQVSGVRCQEKNLFTFDLFITLPNTCVFKKPKVGIIDTDTRNLTPDTSVIEMPIFHINPRRAFIIYILENRGYPGRPLGKAVREHRLVSIAP